MGTIESYNIQIENEPNPPKWPNNIKIINPDTANKQYCQEIYQEIQDAIITNDDDDNDEPVSLLFTSKYHFSNRRFAVFFAPGTYNHEMIGGPFQVGYYVQVAGLGSLPNDVVFEKGCGPFVTALDKKQKNNDNNNNNNTTNDDSNNNNNIGTSLITFWRSVENFTMNGDMTWAVSQAAPMRNVHVTKDLYLIDGPAYASGGHLADCHISGNTYFGGQQQFFCRNVQFNGPISGGAWNLVFTNCYGNGYNDHVVLNNNNTTNNSNKTTTTTITEPCRQIKKPYITISSQNPNKFELRVPQLQTVINNNENNDDDDDNHQQQQVDIRDFTNVRVVSSSDDADPTKQIQDALNQGKDVILAPGIFQLSDTIEINQNNQVLLGIGMATLLSPPNGNPCIHVSSQTQGVRIASLLIDSGYGYKSQSLIEWGEPKANNNNNNNMSQPKKVDNSDATLSPTIICGGLLMDIFCRVGGTNNNNNNNDIAESTDRTAIGVDTMIQIHSNHVIGENLWLWRADHFDLQPNEVPNYPEISKHYHQTEETEAQVQTGIIVTGDYVTIHGLAVEHVNGHQTIWKGNHGIVNFYQCELPYDVTQQSFGDAQYRGYYLIPHDYNNNNNDEDDSAIVVTTTHHHTLNGPGIYSNFRNETVNMKMAIECPPLYIDNNNNDEQIINKKETNIKVINPFTVLLSNHGCIMSVINGMGEPAIKPGCPSRP